MRELDTLLFSYLETRYDASDAGEKQAFEAFLALSDPELLEYLLNKREPETDDLASVVRGILDHDNA